jgi:hypothetical protein
MSENEWKNINFDEDWKKIYLEQFLIACAIQNKNLEDTVTITQGIPVLKHKIPKKK